MTDPAHTPDGRYTIEPPRLRELRNGTTPRSIQTAYTAMIETLRTTLDHLAAARPDEDTLEALNAQIAEWSARLKAMRVAEADRVFARLVDVPGRGQVFAPAFVIDTRDDMSLTGRVTFGDFFLGANGAVHGGAIALLFDEVLGIPANADVATMARTAYLHVNYRSLTPVGRELRVTATLASIDGRKRIVHGELIDGDRRCADAEGLYVELQPHQG